MIETTDEDGRTRFLEFEFHADDEWNYFETATVREVHLSRANQTWEKGPETLKTLEEDEQLLNSRMIGLQEAKNRLKED